MKYQRFTKQQKKDNRRNALERSFAGTGRYLFINNTKGDVSLPGKPGEKSVRLGLNGKFEGDSYYLQYIPTFLRIVENLQEEAIVPDKLILDQPDMITEHGKVEHVVVPPPPQKLKEQNEEEPKSDILLNERPDNDGFMILE